jgi:nitrogen fixation NifU-like protein
VTDELRDLYQSLILDHGKKPRNFGALPGANRMADGHNPLCGDKIRVYLRVEDGVVRDAHFAGAGCAISTASASLMTQAVKGLGVDEALALFRRFHSFLTAERSVDPGDLGKLSVFAGVREFPIRVKCATLAWHTLHNALEDVPAVARTE